VNNVLATAAKIEKQLTMAKAPSTDQTQDQFYKDLMGEDALGVVIRAHIHVEHQLNAFIEEIVPYPDELRPMQLDYSQRVHLVVALGLKEELKKPLLALGTLRNEFAHRLTASLTKARVDDFYETFGGDDKEIIHMSVDSTRKSLGLGAKGKMKHRTPRDKFILYAVTLRAALLAAIQEAKELNAGHG
jgi:imidazoleglycerol phosphate dehydratase HisB